MKHSECKNEVYEPSEDTFLLLKAALAETKPTDSVLEIGCGRGIICRHIAPKVRAILATDINPHAVRMARESDIPTIRADLFKGIKAKFDLIIFNPPYLPTSDEERIDGWLNFALDGGQSGRETIKRFLDELEGHLAPGGRALLLISSLTGPIEVENMAAAKGWHLALVASEKHFFEELCVVKLCIQGQIAATCR
jgi:release factor glutamine methyltransferase